VLWHVGGAIASVAVGMSAGFLLWGARVDTLNQTLDRMILEDDALRARIAVDRDSVTGDPIFSELAAISNQVHAQGLALTDQVRALEGLAGNRSEQLAGSLRECSAIQERIQVQLEQCLFARSELERTLASLRAEAERPQRGTQTLTEKIVVPGVPVGGAKRSDADAKKD